MNNTKHRELRNVIYLVNILNISDSLSPSCITGVEKQFKIKRGLNVCKENIKDLQKDSPCDANIIAVVTQQNKLNGKLLYDVSGSFARHCVQGNRFLVANKHGPYKCVDNTYFFRNSFCVTFWCKQ